ncbi:Crp/Fnr family transcriptional regulator [Gordonia phthalatica]|uniref:Transcriptional regulator n=1 Tax=Gordonia phthalatica TaxID=1136941 RepID=A0A0N9N9D1_9ACTN|nr:Crp/Fnr family transcriptional regulator [Gordonia phthalatica]ALG84829.1 transcriptional regulator [Gordonia phthalatica]
MTDSHEGPIRDAIRLLGADDVPIETQVRYASWVARCVGRGAAAPLSPADVTALARTLVPTTYPAGTVLFRAGSTPNGVWMVRQGQIELVVGTGRRRTVIDVLRAPDVDGDIALLLDMPMAYTARALDDSSCLFLDRGAFDSLLAAHPNIARRWLSSVAQRVAASHIRLVTMLGRPLSGQAAQILLDESVDGSVRLAQGTLAAMLGVQRQSLNKVLKEFEARGLIQIRYGAIDIVDPEGLRLLAQ